jgi:hypothetical protein
MKRLQNLGIMDYDRIDMEDIEHQAKDEDVTTIENNLSKGGKRKKKRTKKICWRLWQLMNFSKKLL